MERRRRPAPFALFGAGLGVVVVVLVFLALTLDLTRDADLPDEDAGGAPGSAAFDDAEPPLPGGPAAAPDADPSLARAPVTDLGTIPSADRLTVTITDPLDLLAQRHELRASGKGSLVCRKWRRDGDLLTATWPDPEHPPAVVEFALQALRPEFVVAASAPLTPDPAGGWRAALDLSECAAFVEFVVTGERPLVVACSLKATFRRGSSEIGTLDMNSSASDPLLVVAPVPCVIVTELNESGRNAQYAERRMFPIHTAGRQRHELPLGTGSVRVVVHEPSGPSNRALTSLLVELTPALERGGHLSQRLAEVSSDQTAFTLVPPGSYELTCYEQQSSTRWLVGARKIEVGIGETLVEFRAPQDRRSLTVHHSAPAGTEFWLLRASVTGDSPRGFLASEDSARVGFENLDAAEWIVWARHPDGVAVARGDTRFQQDAETELGEFQSLSAVLLQPPDELTGTFQVRMTDASGRVVRNSLAWRQLNTSPSFVWPGLLEVQVLHESGRIAMASVMVPPGATDAAPFLIPLNFRYP
jgi:hypothetical protein